MGRGRRKYEKAGDRSRGAVGPTYCPLCNYQAEDSEAFQTVHLEDRRHKYNYLLATFKQNRSVHCPVLSVLFFCVVMCDKCNRLAAGSGCADSRKCLELVTQRHCVMSQKT